MSETKPVLLDEAVENLARAALANPEQFEGETRELADAICVVRDRFARLIVVARELDAYAGHVPDVWPAIGSVQVPVRMLASLRRALEGLELR